MILFKETGMEAGQKGQKNALSRVRRYYPKVSRVVDATKPIKVNVKSCDVSGARKKDPTSCALARSFVREQDCDGAIIRAFIAYLIKGDTATRYIIPHSVSREIVSFDRHKDFRTGEYQLSAIHNWLRLGAKGRPQGRKDGNGGRKHRKPLVVKHSDGMR
jgi:hypothetical protein